MFYRDTENIYRVSELDAFLWLVHGFGTRLSDIPARFGTRPQDVHAAIGPGIGKCCYEVGPEVAAQLGGQGRGHIDLADANRRQLEESGVTPRRIYASNLCTMCRAEEFHSFRRDKEAAGRLHSFAGIR